MMTIAQAGKIFRDWRATRPHKHSPVPVRLRRLAIMIKGRHGCRRTCATLGLSMASLWNWERKMPHAVTKSQKRFARGRCSAQSQPSSDRPRHQLKPPISFIELGSSPPLSSPPGLEWVRPDGVKMKLYGIHAAQLERLALLFFSQDKPRGMS